MTLIEKLHTISQPPLKALQNGSASSVKDFWNKAILPNLPSKETVLAWHNLLMQYIKTNHPTFAIRGFNNATPDTYDDLRRGFLSKTNDFSFFYTDNYHAAYYQKMVLDQYVPTLIEFSEAFRNRKFPSRFGQITKNEKEFIAVKQGNDPKINSAGYKLAHVIPVGKKYFYENISLDNKEILDKYFPRGERSHWKYKTTSTDNYYERDLIAKSNSKKYAIAHFLRFVHPFNYFLCPKKNCEINNKCKEIAEYQPLLDYAHDYMLDTYGPAYLEYLSYIMADDSYYKKKSNQDLEIDIHFGPQTKNTNDIETCKIAIKEATDLQTQINELISNTIDIEKIQNFERMKKQLDDIIKGFKIIIKERTEVDPFPSHLPISKVMDKPISNTHKETIQNWIKRIFGYLFRNNILNEEEIHRLHDLHYSKKTFGIAYALLIDNQKNTVISGHNRYWQTPIGNYYICSQWWKDHDAEYHANIKDWLKKVLPDYSTRGLDRR